MDISLLLSVHICFSVDLGLPDLTISDFEAWALVTWGKEKKTSVSPSDVKHTANLRLLMALQPMVGSQKSQS